MQANPTYRPCPACAADQISDLTQFARDMWRIGMCRICSFVFLRNPVTYSALEEDFAWEKTFVAEDSTRAKKRGFLKRLAYNGRALAYRLKGDPQAFYIKHLGPGRILDIGCGNVVRWRAPFIPFGIELSKQLAAEADAKMAPLGGHCLQGAGAEAIWDFPEDHFDSVMMHSFLEHEIDFPGLLRGSFRTLRPGGRAFIRVPNFSAINRRLSGANWPGFRYPDHVNYFTPATLRTAVEAAGFQFELVNRHKIWLDDNIQALAVKRAQN